MNQMNIWSHTLHGGAPHTLKDFTVFEESKGYLRLPAIKLLNFVRIVYLLNSICQGLFILLTATTILAGASINEGNWYLPFSSVLSVMPILVNGYGKSASLT